jgi:hypothetical protein
MGPGFNDFFSQLPPILYIMFCGSGILLLAAVAVSVVQRRAKLTKMIAEAKQPPADAAPVLNATPADLDLPDLDDLLKPAPLYKPRAGTFRLMLAGSTGEVEAAEVMSVLRNVEDGGLLIQIGDQVYRHPPAAADAEFQRRFSNTVRELAGSAAAPDASPAPAAPPAPVLVTPPPSPTPAPTQAEPLMLEPDIAEIVSAPLEPDIAEIVSAPLEPDMGDIVSEPPPAPTTPGTMPPAKSGSVPLPGDLPKFRMPEKFTPPKNRLRRPPPPDRTPVPEINLAAAIEEYLQHKLELTNEFAGRSFHIRDAGHGGVRIEVDGRFFEAVGDIDDPQARAFIASAIQEWQDRQG